MKQLNSPTPTGPIIGKADKYWTLWIANEPYEKPDWYGTQIVQYIEYQQNLSYDKESAIEKVEERFGDDYRIDEGLRGNRSYYKEGSIEYKDDIFLFGKYKKKKFEEVDDTDYKAWYYDQVKGTDKDSEVLRKELSNLLVYFDDEYIWIDDLEKKVMKIYEENFRIRKHLGKEGDKYRRWVRLRDERTINTTYGYMTIYEFVDDEGNLVFYKGSKDLGVEKDQIVKLEGTIKHEEYYSRYHGKTVQETSLKYPKIVKK